METMGFTQEEILQCFNVIASVLKLGNLQFLPKANMDGTEGCSLMNDYGKSQENLFNSLIIAYSSIIKNFMMSVSYF